MIILNPAGFDRQARWHSFSPTLSKREFLGGPFSNVDLRFYKIITTSLNEFIAFELSLVREVEYVYTAYRNAVFYVWIVVDQFEPEVRKRIYDREKAIIDEFSDFEFDFY